MTDYLDWQSNLSLEQVFTKSASFSYPSVHNGNLYYLTSTNDDRSVLMEKEGDKIRCLTDAPYNIRTLINEYGGKSYWLFEDTLIFVNRSDQCLYQQQISNDECEPVLISPADDSDAPILYAEVHRLTQNNLLAVTEHVKSDSENQSSISFLSLSSKNAKLSTLVEGADFYSNLVVNLKHKKVAWVQWNHPNMPWDEVELWLADLDIDKEAVSVVNQQRVPFEQGANICQLAFAENGRLFFVADFINAKQNEKKSWQNYWNIHTLDDDLAPQAVTKFKQEFGYPHWQYGDQRLVNFDSGRLLAFASHSGGDTLYCIDTQTLQVEEQATIKGAYQSLSSDEQGSAVLVAMPSDHRPCILKINRRLETEIALHNETPMKVEDIAVAEHITYPARDGEKAYGYFYTPTNSAYRSDIPTKEPPLIVMVHGGPTSRSYGFFDIQKQFWTSRGFAVFDVNHRGSSGYGRAYRDALDGLWGVLDINDVIDGIEYLQSEQRIDAKRVCIRGKSAGGYAVLKALTDYPEVFRAGASYYGIGNLLTLAKLTHKFEKRYTDTLLGEEFDERRAQQTESVYYQRSPINFMQNLKSAMIVFQGLKDKVVTPEVAWEIRDTLAELNLPHEYVEYPNEAHGFKNTQTNIDALSKELAFYQQVLAE